MIVEAISQFLTSIGDVGTVFFIIVCVAVIVAITYIISRRLRPSSETPAAAIEFIQTCIEAFADAKLTENEKKLLIEAGVKLLATLTPAEEKTTEKNSEYTLAENTSNYVDVEIEDELRRVF